MKLHLPKGLLVAVLAAMAGFTQSAWGAYETLADQMHEAGSIPTHSTSVNSLTHLVYDNNPSDGRVVSNADIVVNSNLWVGPGANNTHNAAQRPILVQMNGIISGSSSGRFKLNEFPNTATDHFVIYELTNSSSSLDGTIALESGNENKHADAQLNFAGVGSSAYAKTTVDVTGPSCGIINIAGNTSLGGLTGTQGRVTSTSPSNTLTLAGSGTYSYTGTLGSGTYHTYTLGESSTTFGTADSAALNIDKSGSGTQTFTGTANLGAVTVEAGILNLNGATTFNGNISVADDAALNIYSAVTLKGSVTGALSIEDMSGFQGYGQSSGSCTGGGVEGNGFLTDTFTIISSDSTTKEGVSIKYDNRTYTTDANGAIEALNTSVYYVNNSEELSLSTASKYILADTATLTFSDTIEDEVSANVDGNGTVKVTFATGNHDKGINLGSEFGGTISVVSGNMQIGKLLGGTDTKLELISGQTWNNATVGYDILLNAANLDSSYDFAYSTVTLNGKVTGNYLRVTSGNGDNGKLILTNAENAIDGIKVTGRVLEMRAGKVGTITQTGGTVNVSGGTVGHVNMTGGTLNLTGTATIDGTGTANSGHVAGLYGVACEVNIGNGSDSSSVVVSRVELGDAAGGNGGVLNVKDNACLIVTGQDVSGESRSYWKTGFILGEWWANSTLNVSGRLLAQNTSISSGDATAYINIENGGYVAVKGIKHAVDTNAGNKGTIDLTLSPNGTLILGENGIADNIPNFKSNLGGGTIGISSDATIAQNISLSNSETGTTFDTQKYVWSGEGTTTSIAQGEEGGTLTISGVISDYTETTTVDEQEVTTTHSGKLVKDGAGTLKLMGSNTYSGGTKIKGYTLTTGHASALGTGKVSLEGGILKLAAALSVSAMDYVSESSQVQLEANDLEVTGTLSVGENVGMQITGSGATTVNTLQLNAGSSISTVGALSMTNLSMGNGSSMAANETINLNNGTLTLGSGIKLTGTLLTKDALDALGTGEKLEIFSGITQLNFMQTDGLTRSSSTTVVYTEPVDITHVFSVEGVQAGMYELTFSDNTLWASQMVVPEPATATLSLLALAGLCARRRRKS